MTATKEQLQSLLERVEAATGPDRELDADIDVTLFGGEIVWVQANYTMDSHPASKRPSKHHVGGFVKEHVPLVTASIDAALALVERVLPGCLWHVNRPADWTGKIKKRKGEPMPSFEGYVSLGTIGAPDYVSGSSMGHNPALAILAALLKALIAQQEGR